MNAANLTQCPPDCILSDFGLGKLDAAGVETVSQHLETCADCRERVASLSGDSFVGRLKQAGGAAHAAPRERTYIPGESLSNAANSTDGSSAAIRRSSSQPTAQSAPPDVSAPSELANHPDYELIKELGQGGMGTVYLARNRMMDRPEVLKVISKALLDRPGALERFQQEIRSAAKLAHPNIVAAYSVLRPGDLLVFAMEYVKGQDLSQVVKQRGPLPVANAAFYIHQVALGLQRAFEKGMVHRDIKPNNLMLAIDGKKHVVKILDFGLAKASSEKGAEAGLTKSGQMLGTPDYVAPEQTLDAHNADIRADIYSLGCTLYFLLSGGPPFQETSLYEILEAHHKRDPKPLNLMRPEVPVELAAVVAKMMAKDPAKRYQTPVEVAKALVPFFKPGQVASPPPSDAPQSPPAAETVPGSNAATPQLPVEPLRVAMPLPVSVAPIPVAVALRPVVATAPLPAPAAVPAGQFSVSIDTHRMAAKRRGRWSSLPPWQRWAAAAGAAAIVFLGVVLLVHTPHGTIEIELSDPKANVTVTVDGDTIGIAGLDDPVSLTVGEHELKVKGAGYEVITQHFKVTRGKNAPLTVTLVPQPDPPAKNGVGPGSEGFASLFNGKDLTGWKTHPSQPGNWRVENGVLTGSGMATSFLFSERGNFTDFHLRVEARINDRGNSGVYGRAQFGPPTWPADKPIYVNGYEAEIYSNGKDENITGNLYNPGVAAVRTNSTMRPNEWFTLDFIATENHIVVKVNGETTATYDDPARRFAAGHIALQQLDPQTVVEFRKIEIKEVAPIAQPAAGELPRAVAPFDAQQARGHQEAWAKRLGVPVEQTNSIGMKLALIPPGEFMMGSTPAEIDAARKSTTDRGLQGWYGTEAPRHPVKLTKPFYLGSCEVTQGQYREVMGVNPSHFAPGRPGEAAVKGLDASRHPVDTVSWPDAIEFCNKLSVKEGLPAFYSRDGEKITMVATTGYRLPTEAEWEYACRAGSSGRWSFGDDESELPKHAWFAPNSGGRTHAVGELPPNAFGLYDMHGNCTEWIWDLFGGYSAPDATDPTGVAASAGRMARGGTFLSPLFEVRAAGRRESAVPGYKANFNTFRVARTVDVKGAGLPNAAAGDNSATNTSPGSDGWVPLFNGKDLTGWYEPEQNKGTWQVIDGVLVGRGGVDRSLTTMLATNRRGFTDFKLRLEVVRPRSDMGQVIVRAPAKGGHPDGNDGYRIALVSGTAGGETYNAGTINRAVGLPLVWDIRAKEVPLPDSSYTVEIRVSRRTISTFVAGTKVAEYDDPGGVYPSGQIRIVCRKRTELALRRIELQE